MTPQPAEVFPVDAALPGECLYIYGILDRGRQVVRVPGLSHAGVLQTTAVGPVAAVHSWIDPSELDDLEADIAEGSRLAALVRHHDDVVKALAATGPVLPVRLGTLVSEHAALVRLLTEGVQSMTDALNTVRGRTEWDLRITAPKLGADGSPADLPPDEPSRPGAGTNYLLHRRDSRRKAEQLRAALHAAMTDLDEGLSHVADATAGCRVATGAASASCAYLVHESAVDEFLGIAEQGIAALEEIGCTAVLRGPLPPYSFVDIRLEAYRNA
jgi:hypothetical protein